jgi:hypothetical protein
MSIANELSSDVAAALLCRPEEERGLDSSRLVKVIVEVHSTLRQLTAEARRNRRRAAQVARANQTPGSASAVSVSSGHS